MWFALLFVPALVVFAVHLLALATWEKIACWRVRRHVERALLRCDEKSLRQVAAETSEAVTDWQSYDLWALGKAVEITRQRLARAA